VAGVPKDSIRRFLNHSGRDITDHYIRDSALGELQLAEQETISAHLVNALAPAVSARRRLQFARRAADLRRWRAHGVGSSGSSWRRDFDRSS
jgi:hypothetical protein